VGGGICDLAQSPTEPSEPLWWDPTVCELVPLACPTLKSRACGEPNLVVARSVPARLPPNRPRVQPGFPHFQESSWIDRSIRSPDSEQLIHDLDNGT